MPRSSMLMMPSTAVSSVACSCSRLSFSAVMSAREPAMRMGRPCSSQTVVPLSQYQRVSPERVVIRSSISRGARELQ